MIRKLRKILLDIFFPRFCFSCKKEGKYLCEKCTLFISEASFVCPSCNKATFSGEKHKNCEGHIDGLVSFWEYEGVVKEMISSGKRESLIDVFEELMEYGFLSIEDNKEKFSRFFDFLFNEETIISYIPIHKEKELKRGFDPAKEIAKNLARVTKKDVSCLLERNVNTKSQKDLKKKGRILNVEKVFSFIFQKEIKNVVLVNDVWESGSTAKEATRILKEKGAKKVWVFVLAKTP
jgi:competence protein ComFC